MNALLDWVPARAPSAWSHFGRDVLAGLAQRQKSVPCTWLYDRRGSALFERITELPEYYPTRTETLILEQCAAQIAQAVGPRATVVELGSGSSRKTPLLLAALDRPAAYAPVDISESVLEPAARALRARFPALPVRPQVADFTRLARWPLPDAGGRRVLFFPGSTIGNFTPEAAVALLDRVGRAAGPGALMVVGADPTTDPAVLLPAYDDAAGVTAAFNRNLLVRINRELDADFEVGAFRHVARFNAAEHRVEMHLMSEYSQQVSVLGHVFRFAMGETLHTENSCKYSLVRFQALARRAGWAPVQLWTDAGTRFAVHVLERIRAA